MCIIVITQHQSDTYRLCYALLKLATLGLTSVTYREPLGFSRDWYESSG